MEPGWRPRASGADDNTVRVWDVETGRALRVLEGHFASVLSVAWSPDGRRAFSGSVNAVMRIWDLEDSGTKPNAGVADDESRESCNLKCSTPTQRYCWSATPASEKADSPNVW